jgi:hypothetical protein
MKKPLSVVVAGGALLAALLVGRLFLKLSPLSPEGRHDAAPPEAASGRTDPAVPASPVRPSQTAAPRLTPREQLRRAGEVVQAVFLREQDQIPKDLARPEDWATNLPVGWFQLLVRAFPDEAFEHFSAQYLGDPDRAMVAHWALGELARLKHEPTFRLFNAQLESGDPVRARQALKALANYDVPQVGTRILAVAPLDPKDADEVELVTTSLWVAASLPSVDRAALDRMFDHFEAQARADGTLGGYGVQDSRLRASITRASDPSAALLDIIAKETDDASEDRERVEWAADVAVRRGLRDLVPAFEERVRRELAILKENDRLGDLDVFGKQARGEFDTPSMDSFGGLAEVRAIAHLRRVILDLGGTLTEEDRRWLDGLRMLRTPKEYLREAGLID